MIVKKKTKKLYIMLDVLQQKKSVIPLEGIVCVL
jgi:hypothetical protein